MREFIMGLGAASNAPDTSWDWNALVEKCKKNPSDPDCYTYSEPKTTSSGVVIITPPTTTPGHCATPSNDKQCTASGGTCVDNATSDATHSVVSCLCSGNAARRCRVPISAPIPSPGPSGGGLSFFAAHPWLKWALPLTGVAIIGVAYFALSDDGKKGLHGIGRLGKRHHHHRSRR